MCIGFACIDRPDRLFMSKHRRLGTLGQWAQDIGGSNNKRLKIWMMACKGNSTLQSRGARTGIRAHAADRALSLGHLNPFHRHIPSHGPPGHINSSQPAFPDHWQ